MPKIALQTLKESRRGFLGWGIGILALVLLTIAFWPSVKGQESFNDITKDLPDAVKALIGDEDLISPVGYLDSQLFQSMLPALFLVFAISRGTGWSAGAERAGTLEMLLANPVSRTRVIAERSLALVLSVGLLGLVLLGGLIAGTRIIDLPIGAGELAAACLGLCLLAIAFGELGLLLGSLTGTKSVSAGIAAGVAVAGFFLAALGPVVSALEPFEGASPFYYYSGSDPLKNGIDPIHTAVLIGLAVLLALLAARAFERRDLST